MTPVEFSGLLPGVRSVRRYRREWLRPDIFAGLTLTALLIPAGMGYAEASRLPPETGLYATIVPLLVYAVIGPSRTLVLGPDSALAPIIAASILPLSGGDPDRAVALAGLLAILMGAALVLASVARLGFVTDLLSKPIRVGYLNGIALVVIVGQVPKLLGFSVNRDSLIDTARLTVQGLADGLTDPHAIAIGATSLVLMLTVRRYRRRFPALLVAVGGSMVVVAFFGWTDQLPVVGPLPEGLPAPALGGLQWSDVSSMIGPALCIALITFADTAVLSRAFAARRGESVDSNHEMAAVGLASAAAGMLGGFPTCGSSTRTPAAEQAGRHQRSRGGSDHPVGRADHAGQLVEHPVQPGHPGQAAAAQHHGTIRPDGTMRAALRRPVARQPGPWRSSPTTGNAHRPSWSGRPGTSRRSG